MKALASFLLLSSLVAVSAVADDHGHRSGRRGGNACDRMLDLSTAQKEELKKLSSEALDKSKTLRAEVKAARTELSKLLAEPTATKEQAGAASAALKEKVKEISALQEAKRFAVLFDVLSPEQRVKQQKCLTTAKARPHSRSFRSGFPGRGLRPALRPAPGQVLRPIHRSYRRPVIVRRHHAPVVKRHAPTGRRHVHP